MSTKTQVKSKSNSTPLRAKNTRKKNKLSANDNGSHNSNSKDHFSLNGTLDTRELLRVLTEVKNGNFTVRMPDDEVEQHQGFISARSLLNQGSTFIISFPVK